MIFKEESHPPEGERAVWDDAQRAVIEASPGSRLIVEAGPGTGKTAVACARVAHLIDVEGISPANIWLLSFTRTAVKEIRDRIASFVSDRKVAMAVRITTLDSHVWYLRQGFGEQDLDAMTGGYAQNVEGALQLLKQKDEALLDYVDEVQHVIVDEAQDLVGKRGELVCELIGVLSPECGVTVLADSAQAIYGFTNEHNGNGAANGFEAVRSLKDGQWGEFSIQELRTVYRTENREMADAWEKLRDKVLVVEGDPVTAYQDLLSSVESLTEGCSKEDLEREARERSDVLILYRRRAEVLSASSWLWSAGIPHKLRMAQTPGRLAPWLARIFWDFCDTRISEGDFDHLWSERVVCDVFTSDDAELAWEAMRYYAGTGAASVDISRLRRRLATDRAPVEFLMPEERIPGPILGTIHASKGREASVVHLMLPRFQERIRARHPESLLEEGRVVFVGATRARDQLRVGPGRNLYATTLANGHRVYAPGPENKSPRAQVEFGRTGDLNFQRGLYTEEWTSGAQPALEIQEFLWKHAVTHVPLVAEASKETGWRYWLHENRDDGIQWLGCLSDSLKNDLWEIGKRVAERNNMGRLRPGPKIGYLHMVGSATMAVADNDDQLARMLPPFSESGFFLVPCFFGFTNVYYKNSGNW